jgi:hypothetical protein
MLFTQFIPSLRYPFDWCSESETTGPACAEVTSRPRASAGRRLLADTANSHARTPKHGPRIGHRDAPSDTHGVQEPEWQGQWQSLKYL